jgi:RNA polymerase sigma-70 factor (ECF subfamily)
VEAFKAILDRHQAELLRMAHALLGDSHGAQDAVQEAFLRLSRDAAQLVGKKWTGDGRESIGGWLCTVVRNQCIDLLRRRSNAPMLTLDSERAQQGSAPATAVAEDETGEALWQAVADLPPLERSAVVMRYRDGLSYHDIAAQLGKTATHVGVLLHQGLGRLRQSPALRAGVMP